MNGTRLPIQGAETARPVVPWQETRRTSRIAMKILKTDLTRNFAIGFLIGGLIVMAQMGPDLWQQVVPAAQAATIK